MTGCPNDQRRAMLQSSAAYFSYGVGMAKIDSHIAIFHQRFDWVANIALRDDVDFWVATREVSDGFSHAPSRANEQYAHGRRFHLNRTLTYLSPGKGEAIAGYPLKRSSPPVPLRKRREPRSWVRAQKSFLPLKLFKRSAQSNLICFT